jgi:hypothetical protein
MRQAAAEQTESPPPRDGSQTPRCEHTFVTAEAGQRAKFKRAIERRNLWGAEDAARELPKLTLEEARQLVELYAERGSPKYEKAALRWLERYLFEGEPSLDRFAKVVAELARHTS